MPPEKPYWPQTRADFDREAEAFRDKMLPILRTHHLHQLVGLNLALEIALQEMDVLATQEDVRRGARPPGTRLGY